MTRKKLLAQILRGLSDANLPFNEVCGLLRDFGFTERVRGSHHIFSRPDIKEILNLQPRGDKAKSYQVRQIRNIILAYKLGEHEDDKV